MGTKLRRLGWDGDIREGRAEQDAGQLEARVQFEATPSHQIPNLTEHVLLAANGESLLGCSVRVSPW